jgi:hypothetical protein
MPIEMAIDSRFIARMSSPSYEGLVLGEQNEKSRQRISAGGSNARASR